MTDAARAQHFISAAALVTLHAGPARPVLLDVGVPDRGRPARDLYDQGHIPGAVFVDLATRLQAPSAGPAGKRPLPPLGVLQQQAREWGISAGTPVVVYDRLAGTKAGRAWWVLRWAGLTDVRILDGGLAAWFGAGGALTGAVPAPAPGNVTLSSGHLPQLSTQRAVDFARRGRLFDARTQAQYADGHIPGAQWLPTRANLTEDGLLRDEQWLRERFAAAGIDGGSEAGFYCGGAVAAAHEVAVLASLGIGASLFVTSFGGWSADPARDIARGQEAGDAAERTLR